MLAKRVLVIDDDGDIREIAQVSLEVLAGINVILASSGQEGLLKASLEQPDAILLDVFLKDMNGIAVFDELQINPVTQPIPVILLTANSCLFEPFDWHEKGIKGRIDKPFQPIKLAEQVFQILGWQ
jgi:CheY-like chemotaxis protein